MEILQFYPTAAIVKYQRLGDINNRNLFSHGSGGSKSVSYAIRLVLVNSLFLACRQVPSHCVLTWPFLFVHVES